MLYYSNVTFQTIKENSIFTYELLAWNKMNKQ